MRSSPILLFLALIVGCSGSWQPDPDRFLVNGTDFLNFTSPMLAHRGFKHSTSISADESRHSVTGFKSSHPTGEAVSFDFTPIQTFLDSKEDIGAPTSEGDQSSHWKVTWSNATRNIEMEGQLLPDGALKLTYHERLK